MVAWIPAAISAGASLIGGAMSNSANRAQRSQEYERQKEFAKQGVRWKVEDARAAGIHPLAALGAQTSSYSPVAIGDSMGPAMAAAGQDIARGIDATRTGSERVAAYDKTVQDLTLTRMGLENQLLAAQIRRVNQPGHPPARPDLSPLHEDQEGPTLRPWGTSWAFGPETGQQAYEDRYGEIGGEIFGIENLIADSLRNMGQQPLRGPIEDYIVAPFQDIIRRWRSPPSGGRSLGRRWSSERR